MGGASAPPSPLVNPVDALVDELIENGSLTLITSEVTYTLKLHPINTNSLLLYWRLAPFEPRFREWWPNNGNGSDMSPREGAHDLIAAILAEDSFHSSSSTTNQKLWTMACGTAVSTRMRKVPPAPSPSAA
jgi:hypothetical protein